MTTLWEVLAFLEGLPLYLITIFLLKVFSLLSKNDSTFLEREPLENLAFKRELKAYKHFGFWHCMDTLRDKENLEKYLRSKNAR